MVARLVDCEGSRLAGGVVADDVAVVRFGNVGGAVDGGRTGFGGVGGGLLAAGSVSGGFVVDGAGGAWGSSSLLVLLLCTLCGAFELDFGGGFGCVVAEVAFC